MDLSEIRKKLDVIDNLLKDGFCDRLKCSSEVAEYKLKSDNGITKIFDPEREQQILNRITEGLSENEARAVREQFSVIMRNSRSLQYHVFAEGGKDGMPDQEEPLPKKRVILQGALGAYQHIAAKKLFPELPLNFCDSFEEVFSKIDEESVGVLPLENSTAGVVEDVFDALDGRDAFINGSIELNITHSLVGLGELKDVKTVYAHPQALKQCERFLKEGGYRCVPCSNNAVAAKTVSESGSASVAAVCSHECAEIYSLKVLRSGISDTSGNTTRFVVLGERFERVQNADKLAVIFKTQNRPGALAEVLSLFSLLGINVLALHSRPVKETPFEYKFYVEFSGKYNDTKVRALLSQLRCELPYFKLIGTF